MPWICTRCNNEIEYLDFRASIQGWESGSADLIKHNTQEGEDRITDYDYSDSGTDDTHDYEYNCPECNHDISTEDLEWKDDNTIITKIYPHLPCYDCMIHKKQCEHKRTICTHCKLEKEKKDKETAPEETLHNIIKPKNDILSGNDSTPKDNTQSTMICKNKKCKYVFIYDNNHNLDNEFYECPKCQTINNKVDFIENLTH